MPLEITLINPKTKEKKKYTQAWFSTRKVLELLDLTEENYPELDASGWIYKNAEFVASLFDDSEVTTDAILDGVPSNEFNNLWDKAQEAVLGIDPKKAPAKKSVKKK